VKLKDFPKDIRPFIIPNHDGDLIYRCLGCGLECGIEKLLYTCPDCGQVLMIHDLNWERLKKISGKVWRRIFDYRKMLTIPALKGIYLYHEFLGPVLPLDAVIYLGEGHTPIIEANDYLQKKTDIRFYFKNDGQNPSASFKDRGMASALRSTFRLKKGLFLISLPSAHLPEIPLQQQLYMLLFSSPMLNPLYFFPIRK